MNVRQHVLSLVHILPFCIDKAMWDLSFWKQILCKTVLRIRYVRQHVLSLVHILPFCIDKAMCMGKACWAVKRAILVSGNRYCAKIVLRIRDILVQIRIRGSVPVTNGSGSSSLTPTKRIFFSNIICSLFFEGIFRKFVCLTIFA
jgi:hypothetical protein